MSAAALTDSELSLTPPAQGKMAELLGQVEDNIEGIRV
ncbi:MAG TPA: iron-sulfur cluster assembly accessory protein, partial [Gammaproteobacteria bacterium]|nr:iron-sulfur cluster assembly accessory protein [Gammaproteobacteria bacterium]